MACDRDRSNDARFGALRQAEGQISGRVPKHRLGRRWLLLEPAIWIDRFDDDASLDIVRDFSSRNGRRAV